MLPSSAKAKGRDLQNKVCALLRASNPSLSERDIKSTSMGVNGADIQLSSLGFQEFPLAFECKNIAAFAGYKFYEQAQKHAKEGGIPAVVVKGNGKDPLVMLSLEDFVDLITYARESHSTGDANEQ
jgi:hypothetical protein